MQLKFIKGAGKYEKLELLRTGADVELVNCPKQGIIRNRLGNSS